MPSSFSVDNKGKIFVIGSVFFVLLILIGIFLFRGNDTVQVRERPAVATTETVAPSSPEVEFTQVSAPITEEPFAAEIAMDPEVIEEEEETPKVALGELIVRLPEDANPESRIVHVGIFEGIDRRGGTRRGMFQGGMARERSRERGQMLAHQKAPEFRDHQVTFDSLTPGWYFARVITSDNQTGFTGLAEVTEDESTELFAELFPASSLEVQIFENDAPLAGIPVRLEQSWEQDRRRGNLVPIREWSRDAATFDLLKYDSQLRTNHEGSTKYIGLEGGQYVLAVGEPEGNYLRRSVALSVGRDKVIRLDNPWAKGTLIVKIEPIDEQQPPRVYGIQLINMGNYQFGQTQDLEYSAEINAGQRYQLRVHNTELSERRGGGEFYQNMEPAIHEEVIQIAAGETKKVLVRPRDASPASVKIIVRNSEKEPFSNLNVHLIPLQGANLAGNRNVRTMNITDENGEIVLDIMPGSYNLMTTSGMGGQVAFNLKTLGSMEVLDSPHQQIFEYELSDMVICGKIVDDETGEPVQARVAVATEGIEAMSFSFAKIDSGTGTDSNGEFRISMLEDQPYELMISADGYSPKKLEKIKPGETCDSMEIRLTKDLGTLYGYVYDQDGRPLIGIAPMLAVDENANFIELQISSFGSIDQYSSRTGAYEMASIPEGEWRFVFGSPFPFDSPGTGNYLYHVTDLLPIAAGEKTRHDVNMERGGAVTVDLTTSEYRGVPNVELRILDDFGDEADLIQKMISGRTPSTDFRGKFTWNALLPGEYIVRLTTEPYTDIKREVSVREGETSIISIIVDP